MQRFKLKTKNNMLNMGYLLIKARFGNGLRTPFKGGSNPNPNLVTQTIKKLHFKKYFVYLSKL